MPLDDGDDIEVKGDDVMALLKKWTARTRAKNGTRTARPAV